MTYLDPIAGELYGAWYRRREPSGNRKYSIAHVASFCLQAAASGVVGNVAYAGIRALVRRLGQAAAKTFPSMVDGDDYESIRDRLHSGVPASVEVSEEVEIKVRRRYRILVEPRDPLKTGAKKTTSKKKRRRRSP